MSARAVPRWVLPSLLLLAVAVRLFAWSRAAMMMNDGPDFLLQAERLLAGDLRAILGAIAQAALELFGADLCVVYAVNPVSREFLPPPISPVWTSAGTT